MKNCPNCGYQNEISHMRCVNCGYEFTPGEIGSAYNQWNTQNQYGTIPTNDGYAVASLICGLASFVCCGGFASGIAAIILGIIGLSRIKKSGGLKLGKGLAIAGIILGSLGIVVSIIIGILYFIGAIASSI